MFNDVIKSILYCFFRYKRILPGKEYGNVEKDDLRVQNNPFNNDYAESLGDIWQEQYLNKPNASLETILSAALGRACDFMFTIIDDSDLKENFRIMNQNL